jgi:hypothetical protein
MTIYKLELAIERALRLVQGDDNLLSFPDSEIIKAYENTRLDNYMFCNYMTKFCKRSPMSIRAMLVLNDVYRINKSI